MGESKRWAGCMGWVPIERILHMSGVLQVMYLYHERSYQQIRQQLETVTGHLLHRDLQFYIINRFTLNF